MSTKDLLPQLEERLAQTKDPHQRIDLLNLTAWELYAKDTPQAKELAQKARHAANRVKLRSNPYPQGLAESLHILSRCEALLGNYADSISLSLEALEIFEEIDDLAGQGRTYNAMGITYLYMGNYPQALTTLLESLDVFEENKDIEWQARQLNDLGYLYLEIGEPEQSLSYLMPGMSLARQNDLKPVYAELLDNACNSYCAIEEYQQAHDCGLKSITYYREIGAPRGEAKALNSIGDIYQVQEEYQQALDYYNQALQIAESVDYKFQITEALIRIGQVLHLTNRQEESKKYFKQALAVAQEIDARQKIYECHRQLAEVYKKQGDFQKALEQFELFQLVERSVFSSRADNRLKSLQVMHQLKDARHQTEISQLRNVELQQQIEEREDLIADLEAFSHMVAHDLRNPLASIMMSLGMVQELTNGKLGPNGQEYLRIARNMADRMTMIIRELLVLASVRQKDVTLVVVNMREITQNALDVLSFQIDQAKAEIYMPDEWPEVFGYPAWIEEIWANYISNALKYGGNPPIIKMGYTRQEDGRVRFWVQDNGDGITPEQQEKLFTYFSRLNRNDAQGYGLGLSIVQRIAAKLDGEVGVESSGKPGEGCIFYFTLPGMIEL